MLCMADKYVLPRRLLNKIPNSKTTMKCSWGLLMFLDRKALRHETYEEVIWRLVAHGMITKADKKIIEELAYSKHL